MQEVFNISLAGLCIWANYRRAKSKNARVLTGVLFAIFLNVVGVGIFYFKTRTRPQKSQMNSMSSSFSSVDNKDLETNVSIHISGGDSRRKVKAIKIIRANTKMGLEASKNTIESVPCVIPGTYPLVRAQKMLRELEYCGYQAQIVND